jgi:hypothetical protein
MSAVAVHRMRAYLHNFKIYIHERVYNLAIDFWDQFQSCTLATPVALSLPSDAVKKINSGSLQLKTMASDEERAALLAREAESEREREMMLRAGKRPYFNFGTFLFLFFFFFFFFFCFFFFFIMEYIPAFFSRFRVL